MVGELKSVRVEECKYLINSSSPALLLFYSILSIAVCNDRIQSG